MSFEEELKEQIQALPVRELSDNRRVQVLEKAKLQNSRTGRSGAMRRRKQNWKQTGSAVVAAVLLIAAFVGGGLYYKKQQLISRINTLFTPTEAGFDSNITPTPMDTPQFRKILISFLASHSFSGASGSITVPARSTASSRTATSSNPAPASSANSASTSKATSDITHLVIRWSQIKDNYGFVFCTYVKGNERHFADVIAQKDSRQHWHIVMKVLSPNLTTKWLLQYKYFQDIGFGGGLPDRQNQFMWVSGVVLDPAITQIAITLHNGSKVRVPVKNHAYGYVRIQPESGTQYGFKERQGYNSQGKLVHSIQ